MELKYGHRSENAEGHFHEMYKKSRQEGFGEEVKHRILLGSFVLSAGYYDAYYLKALKAKALICRNLNGRFNSMTVYWLRQRRQQLRNLEPVLQTH